MVIILNKYLKHIQKTIVDCDIFASGHSPWGIQYLSQLTNVRWRTFEQGAIFVKYWPNWHTHSINRHNLTHTMWPSWEGDPNGNATQMGRRPRWEGDPDGKATQMSRWPSQEKHSHEGIYECTIGRQSLKTYSGHHILSHHNT